MDLKSRMKKLKRLLKKLSDNNISLGEVTDKDEEKLLHPSALKRFEKLVKRALERPKIKEEVKKIDERIKERGKKNKEKELEKRNEKFLKKHPQFKQVFKYDSNHNQSGDAEVTAKSYMNARKKRLYNLIFNNFSEVKESLKEEMFSSINKNKWSLEMISDMEHTAESFIHKYLASGGMNESFYLENNSETYHEEVVNKLLEKYELYHKSKGRYNW